MNTLDIHRIMQHLPHRYPLLLIDRVLDLKKDISLTAIKNVTINEPFFQGHFPHHPVMPGVLIVEAMAQACGLLAFISLDVKPGGRGVIYLVGIDEARFKRPVEPGDQLTIKTVVTRKMRGIWRFDVNAYVGDEPCCSAEIMSTYKDTVE